MTGKDFISRDGQIRLVVSPQFFLTQQPRGRLRIILLRIIHIILIQVILLKSIVIKLLIYHHELGALWIARIIGGI